MSHAYVNKSQSNDWTSGIITHTPGAAATVCILSIVVQGTTARAGGAPTIDGVTATQADSTRSSTEHQVEVWYVCKAFAGTQFNITIPNTGSLTCHVEVVTANAGTGYSSAYNHAAGVVAPNGSDDGATVNVNSSASGDFLYSRLVCGEAATSSVSQTAGSPTKTSSYANDHGAYTSFGYYAVSDGAGAETFTWTWSNDVGAAVAVAFKSLTNTVLTVDQATHGHAADGAALTQVHSVAVDQATHGHGAEGSALTQAHALAAAPAGHSHLAEGDLAITENLTLAPAQATHSQAADGDLVLDEQSGAVTLTMSQALHDHGAEAPALTQAHTLLSQESAHGQAADAPVLTQVHSLSAEQANHSQAADSPALTQNQTLAVDETLHGHEAEGVEVIQSGLLEVAEAAHGQAADAPVLTQVHNLEIEAAGHAHAVDGLDVVENISLTVAEALHGQGSQIMTIKGKLIVRAGSAWVQL